MQIGAVRDRAAAERYLRACAAAGRRPEPL
jgi:hypothetical protein